MKQIFFMSFFLNVTVFSYGQNSALNRLNITSYKSIVDREAQTLKDSLNLSPTQQVKLIGLLTAYDYGVASIDSTIRDNDIRNKKSNALLVIKNNEIQKLFTSDQYNHYVIMIMETNRKAKQKRGR